jgi:hypothetical protein
MECRPNYLDARVCRAAGAVTEPVPDGAVWQGALGEPARRVERVPGRRVGLLPHRTEESSRSTPLRDCPVKEPELSTERWPAPVAISLCGELDFGYLDSKVRLAAAIFELKVGRVIVIPRIPGCEWAGEARNSTVRRRSSGVFAPHRL